MIKALSPAFIDLVKADGDCAPLLKSNNLEATPCAYANDGTPLKPAVDYATRKRKTGEAKAKEFETHIKTVQVCEAYLLT